MNEMVRKLEGWLIQIGIMPNLAGFTYIKESVQLCCECMGTIYKTTQIYKIIAK